MPRKVNMNLPPDEAAKMGARWVSENMHTDRPPHDQNEKNMVNAIDDRKLLLEIISEFLPVLKQMRNLKSLDAQLQAASRLAPIILYKTMLYGDTKEARAAAESVLNRVQGKPVERTMNMNMDVGQLTETEVDNELNRLRAKFGGPQVGGAEVIKVEGEVLGGDKT